MFLSCNWTLNDFGGEVNGMNEEKSTKTTAKPHFVMPKYCIEVAYILQCKSLKYIFSQ